MIDFHHVQLDQERTVGFTHRALAQMDDELTKRYDKTFMSVIGEFADKVDEETGEMPATALGSIHMGVIATCYKWALHHDDPELTDDDVYTILDKSDLDFGELLNTLIEVHPYLEQAEEIEELPSEEAPEEAGETAPLA